MRALSGEKRDENRIKEVVFAGLMAIVGSVRPARSRVRWSAGPHSGPYVG